MKRLKFISAFISVAFLISINCYAQENRKSVIIYKFLNINSISNLDYLSEVIADQIPLKMVENREFNISIKPVNKGINELILAPDDEARYLLLENFHPEADFIVFGFFQLDSASDSIIIKSYAYCTASGNLYQGDDVVTPQGTLLVENISPLSESYNDIFYEESQEDSRPFLNRSIYNFAKGTYFEFTYGNVYYSGNKMNNMKNDNISSVSLIYSFYDAGLFKETPLINVSGIGAKYIYYDTQNAKDSNEKFSGYIKAGSLNYYLFFRPFEFTNMDFYAGSGWSSTIIFNDPENNGSDMKNSDVCPLFNLGIDFRFIINHFTLTAGAGMITVFMENDFTSFYVNAGAGIRI